MSKTVMLSDEAYANLAKHKRGDESFSDVVNRLAFPPIETFGDLQKYVNELEGPLFPDMDAIRKLRRKKRNAH
jgi:hypothetical protein